MPKAVRRASHAGSWYEGSADQLSACVRGWLDAISGDASLRTRAIIAPHAGHRFCGHVMAYAYKNLETVGVSRVFVLGPSHHVYTPRCMLSSAAVYRTPLGDMQIDDQICQQLRDTGLFEQMNLDIDEAEHSLELHLPFIQEVMRGQQFTLVPVMVGALTADREAVFGRALAPYLDDTQNVFIVSSDFCHWGSRFRYTYYDKRMGPIHKSIEHLDRMGMDIIEKGKPEPFTEYLRQYGNTICGRHPISVFLNMLQHCKTHNRMSFQQYDQSSQCVTDEDSSVSYAAAVATLVA